MLPTALFELIDATRVMLNFTDGNGTSEASLILADGKVTFSGGTSYFKLYVCGLGRIA